MTISYANRDNFSSSFLDLNAFFFLSFFFSQIVLFRTLLKRWGKSGHPCLITDLRELSVFPSYVNCTLAIYGLYCVEISFLGDIGEFVVFIDLRVSILNGYWTLSVLLFLHLRWSCGFSFILLMYCITSINLHMLTIFASQG